MQGDYAGYPAPGAWTTRRPNGDIGVYIRRLSNDVQWPRSRKCRQRVLGVFGYKLVLKVIVGKSRISLLSLVSTA